MVRTETSKLRALRSKTDQQLLELVMRNLELACELGRDPGSRVRALRAYNEARNLLPLVSRLDRRALEPRLQELAGLLYPAPKTAACF
jgi:hypothetical protein